MVGTHLLKSCSCNEPDNVRVGPAAISDGWEVGAALYFQLLPQKKNFSFCLLFYVAILNCLE